MAFIFAVRYLNILRYIFKGLYVLLGCMWWRIALHSIWGWHTLVTASAEIAGKAVFGNGFTSQMRPRKYFVIPKASLERLLDDVEQLINFFVIEFQRVVFAENVYVTTAVSLPWTWISWQQECHSPRFIIWDANDTLPIIRHFSPPSYPTTW